MKKNKEITLRLNKTTLWQIGTVLFAILFLISILTGGFKFNNRSNSGKTIVSTGEHILGNEDAEITIFEFSDFECPFCGRVQIGALAEFKRSDYFKDGDVNLAFKHFPLTNIHQYAKKASEASECAGEQDKFWEYHDVLFLNQKSLDTASLKKYAGDLNLDNDDFNKCLDSGKFSSKVSEDMKEGMESGVRGTPHFILVNKDGKTQTLSGAVPWQNFEAAINLLQ